MASKEGKAQGDVAELFLLGDWKVRRLIFGRLQKLTLKERFTMILWACFVDVCKIMYGKDWVRKRLNGDMDESDSL